jgi:hypothetical protein
MSQAQSRRFLGALGPLQVVILALVVVTALVHLQRGISTSAFLFGGGFRGGPPGGGPPGGGFPPGGGAGRFPGGPPGGFNIMRMLPLPLPILFFINAIGYLVLGGALYLPALAQYRAIVRWLLIIFAATTFVLYFLINGFRLSPLVVIDKITELSLIVLLFIDGRQARSTIAGEIEAEPVAT